MSCHADTIRLRLHPQSGPVVSKNAALNALDALVAELEAARQETLEARAAVAEIEGAYERLVEHDNRRAIVLAYEARGEALRRVTAERDALVRAAEDEKAQIKQPTRLDDEPGYRRDW